MNVQETLTDLAQDLRQIDAYRQELIAERDQLAASAKNDIESLADVAKRGGLLPQMPTILEERRRSTNKSAIRLVCPQRHGQRTRIYLGTGRHAARTAHHAIQLRKHYEWLCRTISQLDCSLSLIHRNIQNTRNQSASLINQQQSTMSVQNAAGQPTPVTDNTDLTRSEQLC